MDSEYWGGAHSTRPVASAGGGQDDHLSETVSQCLEPVANTWKGGRETNSTQDFVSKFVELNKGNLDLEDINLAEVDKEIEEEEERADREYARIDEEEFQTLENDKPESDIEEGVGITNLGVGGIETESNLRVGISRGQAKVHFQVPKNYKMSDMDSPKKPKTEILSNRTPKKHTK